MVFQDPSTSLDPVWTVGDQVAETIRAHSDVSRREAKERAVQLMNGGRHPLGRRSGTPTRRTACPAA